MIDIINLILLIILTVAVCRFIIWFSKRIALIIKLYSLKSECGATVKFLRFPFLPTSLMAERPDVIVQIRNKIYLIKLYSGGATKFVHFASPKYSVRFSKMRTGRFATSTKWRSAAFSALNSAFNVGAKVFILPEFPIPESFDLNTHDEEIEKIILFSPAPYEVSYVTEEKTTIKLAFTGDEFYGIKIFTTSSLIAYADRETRKNDELMYF